MDKLINKYNYDMAKMEQQAERKSPNIAKRKQFKKYADIDPETGQPRKQKIGEDPDVEIFDNEFEELSKGNPTFATEEFQAYMKKREAARQK